MILRYHSRQLRRRGDPGATVDRQALLEDFLSPRPHQFFATGLHHHPPHSGNQFRAVLSCWLVNAIIVIVNVIVIVIVNVIVVVNVIVIVIVNVIVVVNVIVIVIVNVIVVVNVIVIMMKTAVLLSSPSH